MNADLQDQPLTARLLPWPRALDTTLGRCLLLAALLHLWLAALPRPPERDDKLALEIEKAGKSDCRQACGGMGPLAVIPLAVDALRKDGGCKW